MVIVSSSIWVHCVLVIWTLGRARCGECRHAWFVRSGNCGDSPHVFCKKAINPSYIVPSLSLSLRASISCVPSVCTYEIIIVVHCVPYCLCGSWMRLLGVEVGR